MSTRVEMRDLICAWLPDGTRLVGDELSYRFRRRESDYDPIRRLQITPTSYLECSVSLPRMVPLDEIVFLGASLGSAPQAGIMSFFKVSDAHFLDGKCRHVLDSCGAYYTGEVSPDRLVDLGSFEIRVRKNPQDMCIYKDFLEETDCWPWRLAQVKSQLEQQLKPKQSGTPHWRDALQSGSGVLPWSAGGSYG